MKLDAEDRLVMYSPRKGGFLCGFASVRTRDNADIAATVSKDPYDERTLAWTSEEDRQNSMSAVLELVRGVAAILDADDADWMTMVRIGRDTRTVVPDGSACDRLPEIAEEVTA